MAKDPSCCVLFEQVMGSGRATTWLHIDVTLLLRVHALALGCCLDLLLSLLFANGLLLAKICILSVLVVCIELIDLLEAELLS